MSENLEASRAKKHTVQQLAAEVDHLCEHVEDLEDLRDLKEAVQRNGDKPLIPLVNLKKDVDID